METRSHTCNARWVRVTSDVINEKTVCITCNTRLRVACSTHRNGNSAIPVPCLLEHTPGMYGRFTTSTSGCYCMCACCFEYIDRRLNKDLVSRLVCRRYVERIGDDFYDYYTSIKEGRPLPTCATCLNELFPGTVTTLLPCCHNFCSSDECEALLLAQERCPLCRVHITRYMCLA